MSKKLYLVVLVAMLLTVITSTVSAGTGGGNIYLPMISNGAFTYSQSWDVQWTARSGYGQPGDRLTDKTTWEVFADNPVGAFPWDGGFLSLTGDFAKIEVAEDGYLFVATGEIKLDNQISMNYQNGNIYLLVIRGLEKVSRSVVLSSYAGGVYSKLSQQPYITLGWMLQQVEAGGKSPNCGSGCSKVTLVVTDLESNTFRVWTIDPNSPRTWARGELFKPQPTATSTVTATLPTPTIALTATSTATPTATPTATATSTITATATATMTPTITPTPTNTATVPPVPSQYSLGWSKQWHVNPNYGNPSDKLSDDTTWDTFAGPLGVWPSNQWVILSGTSYGLNVQAGAYSFVSTGALVVDSGALSLPWRQGNNYLVIFRGFDPAKFTYSRTVSLSGYAGGITNVMPAGPFVSLDWITQQISNSANTPNCGNGCTTTTIVVVDLTTASYRVWGAAPTSPRNWTKVQ